MLLKFRMKKKVFEVYKKYRNAFGWCSYPWQPEPLGYCWAFAHWVDGTLIVKEKKIETKEDLWKFCNEGCDCFNGKQLIQLD